MAHRSDGAVALISIHPKYADLILAGEKRVELRKTVFTKRVTHVVIYSTAPVARVVGWFEVAGMHEGSPHAVWQRFSDVAGLSRQEFRNYYKGARKAVAIAIGRTHRFPEPKQLSEVSNSPPPQNFVYLDASVFAALRES